MNKKIAYLTAFTAGFALMGFEIIGPRILNCSFGNTNHVWGAIITVLLSALCIGYFLGGYIADHTKHQRYLPFLMIIPGAIILISPFYSYFICKLVSHYCPSSRFGTLLASAIIFLPPATFLGTISPILMKHTIGNNTADIGKLSSKIYLLSTLGCILGTILTSFYLIGAFSTSVNIMIMGTSLTIIGILNFFKQGET